MPSGRKRVTINGEKFTVKEIEAVVRRRADETLIDFLARLCVALKIDCVID